MTDNDKISRIIEIELEITNRIIKDRTFRATDNDEYKDKRKEVIKLRNEVAHLIHTKSYLNKIEPWMLVGKQI